MSSASFKSRSFSAINADKTAGARIYLGGWSPRLSEERRQGL